MDHVYSTLSQRVVDKWNEKKQKTAGQARLLIALAGPPGSGKTTIAQHVVQQVNSLPDPHPKTICISADGFHLTQLQLRAMPNAAEAIARRGAPWTFDGAAAVALVRELGSPDAVLRPVLAPTFDHQVKDPVAGGLSVAADVEVCIIEGNYLLIADEPWCEIGQLVDDRWLVHVEPELARLRVAKRHLKAGIEDSMDKALARVEGNDMVNGALVAERSEGRYDILVKSFDEPATNFNV
jgi:pantothenate kinase